MADVLLEQLLEIELIYGKVLCQSIERDILLIVLQDIILNGSYIFRRLIMVGQPFCHLYASNHELSQQTGGLNIILQGIATSIDALSVGFTMAELQVPEAIAEAVIIGVVTMGGCLAGIFIGRKAGDKLAGKATIFGGIILIAIGLEIFLSHML